MKKGKVVGCFTLLVILGAFLFSCVGSTAATDANYVLVYHGEYFDWYAYQTTWNEYYSYYASQLNYPDLVYDQLVTILGVNIIQNTLDHRLYLLVNQQVGGGLAEGYIPEIGKGPGIAIAYNAWINQYSGSDKWSIELIPHEETNLFTGNVVNGWPKDWWADDISPFPYAMKIVVEQNLGHYDAATASLNSADALTKMFLNFRSTYGVNIYSIMMQMLLSDGWSQWFGPNPSLLLSEYVAAYLSLAAGSNLVSQINTNFLAQGISYQLDPNVVQAICNSRQFLQQIPRNDTRWQSFRQGEYASAMWTYVGSAYLDAANADFVLTQATTWQVGAIWLNQPIASSFTASFSYKIGGGTGADGLVMMFYKQENYSIGAGGYLGFNNADGLPVPGYGIEFDSWWNPEWDPSNGHIALIKDSVANHLVYENDSRVDDNQWHTVIVNVTDSSVMVYVDSGLVLNWIGNIDRTYGGLGFGAATGDITNLQMIRNFSISYSVPAYVITITSDGSIDPPTAPIYTADKITYTLTGNITSETDGIVIERDNIVLDGAGHAVTGSGSGNGITLTSQSNVTVRKMTITNFAFGMWLTSSSSNVLSGNNVANNTYGVYLDSFSNNNSISGNNITANNWQGIWFDSSSNNSVGGNNITNNGYGILLDSSSNNNSISVNNITNRWDGILFGSSSNDNSISGNNIIANKSNGILLDSSSNNKFYHNSFVDNTRQVYSNNSTNIWDDGYPSGGNFWSDYSGTDLYWGPYQNHPGSDGIGDTPYIIDANNTDNYPLTSPWGSPSTYVTINAHCNTEGIDVAVPITEDGSATGYTTPHSFNITGTHTFTVANADPNGHAFLQWSTGQTNTSITVSSGGTFTAYYGKRVGFISVESEFSGYFLQNVQLTNTFGVYTNISGISVVGVYGTLDGVNYTFSNPQGSGGSYNLTVNMGSLQSNSILEVSALYSDGTVLNASYPITILWTPSWLMSILNAAKKIDVEEQMSGEWNNTYYVNVEQEFNLSKAFNVPIPLPNYEGGGNYTLLPSIEVDFTFYSNGTFNVSAPFTLTTPKMDFGVAALQFHVTINASGEFGLQNNTIEWQSATFSFVVGANTSVNIPIAGGTFEGIHVGLTATINVDANFAANIVLAPTQNASQELISGLELMIQNINGQVSFDVGVALNAGIGIVSVSGGGSINFTFYLKVVKPYISGGVVSGTVYIKCHFLIWERTLWSMTGRLYEWGSDPYTGSDSTSNFTLTSRYYNTTDYEGFVWTDGYGNATAIQDVYPFTRISAAVSGDSVYLLYSSDNLSVPQENGLCLAGLQLNTIRRALQNLTLPLVAGEILFDPVVTSLPNGTLLAMWDSVPFSEVSNATSPLDISDVIPQYSFFDNHSQSWGPIVNLTGNGIATSYQLSSDSTGCYGLVLEGDSIFPTSQYMVEYNMETGSELLNISVTNVTNIISFNSLSHIAVLQMNDGSYELMDISSGGLITLPQMSGYEIENVQFAMNSTDFLGILYSNSNSSVLSIYNVSSNTVSFSMNVSQSTNGFALMQAGSTFQLITSDPSGITSYKVEYQTEARIFYPIANVTSMGAILTDKGILVYTTENYGNSSSPLLNLTFTYARSLTGDVNGDFKVDMKDIATVASAFGSKPAFSNWNLNADINNDAKVDMKDIATAAANFGQHYP